ncbi:MAG TPA: hypothetical protein PLE57_07100 [Methanoregulaceae archaeon]|nr:hypothetical protein [Methanoregulaceae archaeon]
MDSFMLKWGLIFKAPAITALLLAIDCAGMDILTVTNPVTAFVGGVIFTIAIIPLQYARLSRPISPRVLSRSRGTPLTPLSRT